MATYNTLNTFNPQQVINNATAPVKGQLPTFAYALQTLIQPGMAVYFVHGKCPVPYTLIRVTPNSVVLCPLGYPVTPANYVRKRLTPYLLNRRVDLYATKQAVNTIATALQAQLGTNPVFAPGHGDFSPAANYIVNFIFPYFCCTDAADLRMGVQLLREYFEETYPLENTLVKAFSPAINAIFARVLETYYRITLE